MSNIVTLVIEELIKAPIERPLSSRGLVKAPLEWASLGSGGSIELNSASTRMGTPNRRLY